MRIEETGKRWSCRMGAVIFMCLAGMLAGYGEAPMLSMAAQESGQTALYCIGSTSKVITAAAVMKLYEEGKVDLDEPLTTYIPEFEMEDERYQFITPRMLLNHTSGLQGSTLNATMLLGMPDTANHDGLLAALKTQRLKADPGDFAVYCNDGFTLAEILTERVSGLTFTEYISREFAAPMGLRYIKTSQSDGVMEQLSPVYDSQTGKQLPPEAPNVIGSGGIYATAEDLCRLSQIFMDKQGDGNAVISRDFTREMENSDYRKTVNPDGRDTSLSFGMGWDCVGAYPFNRYGINALVKGGDTSYYHASLTVLPEENISCAVLTSGAASIDCQLAVQEILLAYLEETGRIERKSETASAENSPEPEIENAAAEDIAVYENHNDVSGWYAGDSMMLVQAGQAGTLTVSTEGTGRDRTQTYTYDETDQTYHSTDGYYIDGEGSLVRGNSGKTGKTQLWFQTDEKNRTYLMAHSYETYPGLGKTVLDMPVAQKLDSTLWDSKKLSGAEEKAQASDVDLSLWKSISGKEFYPVSEPYTSAFYLSRFMVKPVLLEEPSGYLAFEDASLKMARIKSFNQASFFQQIPGQAGRDLSDYEIVEKNGKTYFQNDSFTYICEDEVEILSEDVREITIGPDGEACWYRIEQGAEDGFITIETPVHGAWYIYDRSGKKMKYTSSSWTSEAGAAFLLLQEGRIVFAGEPGETFVITHLSGSARGTISSVQKPSSKL